MTLDLEAMKAAALAAEPGPWEVDHAPHRATTGCVAISAPGHIALAQVVWQMDGDVGHDDDAAGSDVCRANATHIATANPAAVLALIERLERAEAVPADMPNIMRDDFPTLRKRCSALWAIAKAKELRLATVSRDLADLRAQADPEALASERAANAALTKENDRLQRRLDAAEGKRSTLKETDEVLADLRQNGNGIIQKCFEAQKVHGYTDLDTVVMAVHLLLTALRGKEEAIQTYIRAITGKAGDAA